MLNSGAAIVTTPTDREIVVTRRFNASRELVWKALTTPVLIRRWLLGPPGWEMTRCEFEPRVGGKYRYEWKKDTGEVMGMSGVIKEFLPPERLAATELFDTPWYPGPGEGIQVLSAHEGGTTLVMTLRYESKEARDMVVQAGATAGMEFGYARLDVVLREIE